MNRQDPYSAFPHESQWAGLLLIVCSILALIFMTYHPTAHGHTYTEYVEGFAQTALMNGVVHGCLVGLGWLILVAFSFLSACLGWGRLLVCSAFAAFAVATLAMSTAAFVGGFIMPKYVADYHALLARETKSDVGQAKTSQTIDETVMQQELKLMKRVMGLAWACNQVCAKVGVLASALSWVLWSLAMFRRPLYTPWVSLLGILAGVGIIIALLTNQLPMNVHGMLAYIGIQSIWSISVGYLMWKNRIGSVS